MVLRINRICLLNVFTYNYSKRNLNVIQKKCHTNYTNHWPVKEVIPQVDLIFSCLAGCCVHDNHVVCIQPN